MTTINDLLRQHVTLDVECLERMYLNGYVPTLQMPGQLVTFLTQHRGNTIPSPVLLQRMSEEFVQAVRAFATANQIPLIHFERGVRKDEVAAEYRSASDGVVFIGIAREKAQAFKASKRTEGKKVGFDYSRQAVFVNYYYTSTPKTQTSARRSSRSAPTHPLGSRCISMATSGPSVTSPGPASPSRHSTTGSSPVPTPPSCRRICDRLGVAEIQAFFAKWLDRLPLSLATADRQAGYDYRLAIWQMEVSRTQVFPDPARGREFFEEVMRENLDLGRPDRIQLLFERRVQNNTPGLSTPGSCKRAWRRACTSSTCTATSSSISRRATPCAPRPRSTTRQICACAKTSPICPTCNKSDGRSIDVCWTSNG